MESMAAMNMVAEDEATSRVSEIYDDIKDTFRIDVVPNMYKAMAPNPAYLEANWDKSKAAMIEPGKLERLTKIITVAVSAVNSCNY